MAVVGKELLALLAVLAGILRVETQEESTLYVIRTDDIIAINVTHGSDLNATILPLPLTSRTIVVDRNPLDDFLYWTSPYGIYRAKEDGTAYEELHRGLGEEVDGVAVDWVAGNVYWTDASLDTLSVSRLDGTHTMTVFRHMHNPRDVVLYLEEGKMYFSEWGSSPRIATSSLNGENVVTLVSTDIVWPNALALDKKRDVLYFADASLDKIEVINLNGSERRLVTSVEGTHIYGLSFLDDYLYWTDWNTYHVTRMPAANGSREVIHSSPTRPLGLRAMHVKPPNITNGCAKNNGGCSHLCLFTPEGVQCGCDDASKLNDDGQHCNSTERSTDIPWTPNFSGFSYPTTSPIVNAPENSFVKRPLERIGMKKAFIANGISDFYYYMYDGSDGSIGDGGSDMYDSGNKVYFWTDWEEERQIRYQDYNSFPGVYEYWSSEGWPFTLLVYINNTEGSHRNFTLQVRSNTGADGNGNLIYFSSNATAFGISVFYTVTQVYGTSDPTICEVYMVLTDSVTLPSVTTYRWNNGGTDGINSGITLTDYAQKVWSGYMLLSKSNGQYINQNEVNRAVGIFSSAVFDRNETIPFNFPISPTVVPQSTPSHHATTSPTTFSPLILGTDKNSILYVARYSDIAAINVTHGSDMTAMILPFFNTDRSIAVDYNPIDEYVYWTNPYTIHRAKRNGSDYEILHTNLGAEVDGIAVDWVAGNLYWTDASLDTLSVSKLNGSQTRTLFRYMHNPRDVILDLEEGRMCFSEWGFTPRIACCSLNGENVTTLVSTGIVWPNALALDKKRRLLYFADASLDKIEVINLNGSGRQVVTTTGVTHIYGLSFLDDYLYWTDWETNHITRMLVTDQTRDVIHYSPSRPMGLRVIRVEQPDTQNDCGENNGYCSHLCFFTPPGAKCGCPDGMEINTDDRTCSGSINTTPYPGESSTEAPFSAITPQPAQANSTVNLALSRIDDRKAQIVNSIPYFFQYKYDDRSNMTILDGGNDMYDSGNKVYFWVDDEPKTWIRYGSSYAYQYAYEFGSTASWPFVALMYIDNQYYNYRSFSLQVVGDAGADGGGRLVYFNGSATANGIRASYIVTQVYDAGDPSITEVFFAFSSVTFVSSRFAAQRPSFGTNNIDTTVTLDGYPRQIWLGYMLLSKSYGRLVTQQEVNNAVSEVASAIFGYSYTVYFPFPILPTMEPTVTTTPRYQFWAYKEFRQEVCGSYKFSTHNTTQCTYNEAAFVTTLTVEIPTLLGYSYPVQGTISGCVSTDLCYQGCSNISQVIDNSQNILDCNTRCCYYSYCNYNYYYSYYYYPSNNHTPPNITIPAAQLPEIPVEIFPNCVFRSIFPRFKSCLDIVFNSWPFGSVGLCKSSIKSAMQCVFYELSFCSTPQLFSSAMFRLPPDLNITQVLGPVEQSGILDVICEHPADNIHNANLTVGSGYYAFEVPLFPPHIGFGEPICDRFILDSLMEWGIEFLTVIKTSTQRYEMCRSLKGVIQKTLDASKNRCNLDMIPSMFPCDSVLRNQIRALIVQVKQLAPDVLPDYCAGIQPPTEPETPDDISFLPSCTLRQAVKSVWSCESIFTKSAPYSDKNSCKTNINRLLHCVANRLQECGRRAGFNLFDSFSPFIRFEDILAAIRSAALPVRCDEHTYDVRDLLCSSSAIHMFNLNSTIGNLFGICNGDMSHFRQKIMQAYHQYAGAFNAAEVCIAFRSIRDWISDSLEQTCDFSLLRYLLPLGHPARAVVNHGIEILMDMLPDLEISACPALPSASNDTVVSPSRWLRTYVRWRSHTIPKWQAAYEKWRSEQPDDVAISHPSCLDLTSITCKNIEMKLCESDYFGCQLCYCADHKYKGLNSVVLKPWLEDYENWERFQNNWEESFSAWQEDADQ